VHRIKSCRRRLHYSKKLKSTCGASHPGGGVRYLLGGISYMDFRWSYNGGEMTYADSPTIKAIDGTTEGDSQS
jgi:hypothetical protein